MPTRRLGRAETADAPPHIKLHLFDLSNSVFARHRTVGCSAHGGGFPMTTVRAAHAPAGPDKAAPVGRLTDELAILLLSWRWQDFDAELWLRTRMLLLDSLGCALAARGHPVCTKVSAAAAAMFPGDQATGLGSLARLSVAGASLDSGAAIRALDFNDFYWGPGIGGHPSDLFAPALAVAEHRGCSISEMLRAVAAGYEVYGRMLDLMAATGPFDHGTAQAVGTAAIAGLLQGLDAARLSNALALAFCHAPALIAVRYGAISEAKSFATAFQSVVGLTAVGLAAAGLGGPADSIAGDKGLAAVLIGEPERLALPALQPEIVTRVAIKRYPCIGTAQAVVAAAVELRRRIGPDARIRSATFRISDSEIARHQTSEVYRRPRNRETADHSFFALAGMALADGDLSFRQLLGARFLDADVTELIGRLTFACELPGVERGRFPAEGTVVLEDGAQISVEVDFAPGHPRNPLDADEVRQKFRACAEPVIGARADQVAALCLNEAPDQPVGSLIGLLRAEPCA